MTFEKPSLTIEVVVHSWRAGRMRILVASSICDHAIRRLRESHEVIELRDGDDLAEQIASCDVLIFRSDVQLNEDVLDSAEDLRLLIRAGSGMDNVPLDLVEARGLDFTRIPAPSARSVAELTLGLMIALSRNIVRADRDLRLGKWTKQQSRGSLLEGKTVGIVGAGNIGSTVGKLAVNWGMHALGCIDPETDQEVRHLHDLGIDVKPMLDVVANADFVTLHVPLTTETQGLVDDEFLGWMKDGSYLVNVARGGVVDEAALRAALLRKGGVHAAALDVHERERDGVVSPLADLENVILTPHIGSMSVETQREIGRRIVHFIDEYEG